MNTPLIDAVELAARLRAREPVVLLDARNSPAAYREGHLRGARCADPDRDLSGAGDEGANPRHGGRHPLPALEAWRRTLGRWGIAPQTDVVVYDAQSGANAAARAWWMLRSVGHDRVAVLDGGLQAAVAAGLPLTTDVPPVDVLPPYPADRWRWPVVSIERVDELRASPHARVIDVRSGERFRGESEPIDPIAGHIPGAVNFPYTENLHSDRFKPAAALREQYEQLLGSVPPEHVVVHCGSGVTACHTLLALEAAGLPGAALYVGSWSEWCRNDERPRATAAK